MFYTNRIQWLFLLGILIGTSCTLPNNGSTHFQLLTASRTGIHFENSIIENDTFHMYNFMNIYTGGGVAIGDINNDGMEDLFFSGNNVPSALYLNKGNLKFEEISLQAGIQTDRWCAGAAMVDINQDGYLDIYIAVTGNNSKKENLLYINQGDATFKEQAKAYGLADSRQCMHSSFFDYDKDGDLDLYVIVNPVNYELSEVNRIKERSLNGENESTDVLYRNNGDNTFTDVSAQAGILVEGYSLGLSTCDINGDNWPDIYVSNDFLTNDILYINNGNGTFSNKASTSLKHTSFAGMGNDVSDFNNDGLPDIVVADMLPEDNKRRKLIIPSSSYDKYQLTQTMGYEPQYTRNTLQLNNGDGTFSEVGQLAGIDQTDWSWSSLFADYDNDGDKDLMITNGFLRDVGNLDYISYQQSNKSPFGKKTLQKKKRLEAIQALGAAKIPNYIFENKGNMQFKKRSVDWGMDQKTCSNGAAFADLDDDGDLELIFNNVNDNAFIYENKSECLADRNYLKIKFIGPEKNRQGLGTKIEFQTSAGKQYYEHNLYRGYESTVSQIAHFGLGADQNIKTLKVTWPDGSTELLSDLSSNQTLTIQYKSTAIVKIKKDLDYSPILFEEVSQKLGLDFKHIENEYIDFKVQPLIPHEHSKNGPGIAAGDINGDQIQDLYISGASGQKGAFYLQNKSSLFTRKNLELDSLFEDMGSLLFDVENDGDLDLYVVSGGTSFPINSNQYQDRLYLNDGLGNFTKAQNALPNITESGSTVNACDYDKDGDLDLFVGGRIQSGAYPLPATSFLLKNETQDGKVIFTKDENTSSLKELGLVTSALWTDIDNDQWMDLIVVGEWMPITIFKNEKGTLKKQDHSLGLEQTSGWWNSIQGADFDSDGDTDYILGNLGLNSRYKASVEEPVCIYAKDFDKNGRIDPVLCHFIDNQNQIAHPRDLLIKQINSMRGRFKSYTSYAETEFDRSFTKEEIEDAYNPKAVRFESSYMENLGNGEFKIRSLPVQAQFSPVFGIQIDDVDADGDLDALLVGNSFCSDVAIGNYDALQGLTLYNDGKGNFNASHLENNGFHVDGDVKSLVKLYDPKNTELFIAGRNSNSLKTFRKKNVNKIIPINTHDEYALLYLKNGRIQKEEFYYGNGYLSASSRMLIIPKEIEKIELVNSSGEKREMNTNLFW